jgi:hypothetical protein
LYRWWRPYKRASLLAAFAFIIINGGCPRDDYKKAMMALLRSLLGVLKAKRF